MSGELMFASVIIELILKYGIPGALEVIYDWDMKNPTAEDIQALRMRVLKPETYFED